MLTRMHVVSLVSVMFTCVYVPGNHLRGRSRDRVIFYGHEPGSDLVGGTLRWYSGQTNGFPTFV